MKPYELIAHEYASNHRAEIEAGPLCGCFCCLRTFPPTEIVEWVDHGTTAVCPRCGVDAVLGGGAPLPVTDSAFLRTMNAYWFSVTKEPPP